LWVVDNKGEVFVYDNDNNMLGGWDLKEIDKPEGITVHDDDLWIVDREDDRVHFFKGGALRRSGEAEPTSSFSLGRGNRNPMDLVTDGTHIWVVNNTRNSDKVFRYTVSGTLEGSWEIDAANAKPTGLTIDPNDVNHIWIVDSGSDSVYQYDGATGRTLGQQAANPIATFALDSANRNPQGIADPRPFGTADSTAGDRTIQADSRVALIEIVAVPDLMNRPTSIHVATLLDEAIEQLTEEGSRLDLPALIDGFGIGDDDARRLPALVESHSVLDEARDLNLEAAFSDLFGDLFVDDESADGLI
jgi:hypothetical protein